MFRFLMMFLAVVVFSIATGPVARADVVSQGAETVADFAGDGP